MIQNHQFMILYFCLAGFKNLHITKGRCLFEKRLNPHHSGKLDKQAKPLLPKGRHRLAKDDLGTGNPTAQYPQANLDGSSGFTFRHTAASIINLVFLCVYQKVCQRTTCRQWHHMHFNDAYNVCCGTVFIARRIH